MSVLRETTIKLKDAAKRLYTTYGTATRWRKKGNADGKILEAVKVGGVWYTSIEALERFSDSAEQNSDDRSTAERTKAHPDPAARDFLRKRYGFGSGKRRLKLAQGHGENQERKSG